MATKKDLLEEIEKLKYNLDLHIKEVSQLNDEIDRLKDNDNIVSKEEYNQIVKELNNERLIKKILNSTIEEQKKKIKTYSQERDTYIKEIENLRKGQQLKVEHNSRNAGRKSILDKKTKDIIKFKYNTGVSSMGLLAKEFNVSKSTIFNIIRGKI